MEIESHRAFIRAFHAADDNDQRAIIATLGKTTILSTYFYKNMNLISENKFICELKILQLTFW